MKGLALLLAAVMLFTVACGQLQQQHYEGAGAGAVIGGIAGALLDKKIHGAGGNRCWIRSSFWCYNC